MQPKLLSFDAFNKTDEEVRIRTRTGGIITLFCILTTLYLLQKEWIEYYKITNKPQVVVDRDRHLKLELNLDITFPSLSCDLIGLDIVDDSGETSLDVLESGFTKIRVDTNGNELDDGSQLDVGTDRESLSSLDMDKAKYCGPCYGALDQSGNDNIDVASEKVCCQTCYDVRKAYTDVGWAFFDGKDIEQCEREGYVDRINDHLHEGCRIVGSALLNRIQGNVHFAPGAAFETAKGHFHDTSLYDKTEQLNFNHIINHLSFGKTGHELLTPKSSKSFSVSRRQPLDGRVMIPESRNTHFFQFSYFAKIVPTRFESLSGKVEEAAQYSVTFHSRPLQGGRDEDHPNTFHGRSGIPGLFIYFQMAPLKVIDIEAHSQTFSGLLLNCITTIGGVLAVGTMMDKVFYKAQRSIWGKKNQ
ncbi:hypothetical protein TBLA_0F01610 [Henningerozyma blattae CBS 6284]|uniref:Endoplasmic reticulum-Golgi intermediate compartment protein n=1 Tax=Henningerozyma blattae (strain ATCC 34711 / CBS 6284 / DSM 70876 / NBRC 10599 / NRRL Y-10934 / UCD 77-7) TaxID=1071380 RepID=I2H5Q1_HENB6|nr:hypothetical protein TBLA_0F01610 [Tetrapisispora blattae CBS 6284]CCH61703.1 hypothetical protein TBLA_0F01610 [Tetrapisispora blattae CBS 6284]